MKEKKAGITLGAAMEQGARASGEIVRIVMSTAATVELQQKMARQIGEEGYQVRVVYGVLPSAYVAVEGVERDGTVTELARKALP